MHKTKRVFLFLLALAFSSPSLLAGNVMLKTSTLLVDDPLTAETWERHWKPLVGIWKWQGDSIKAIEKPEDKHHAGAGRIETMTSGVIEVEFRMDDSKRLQFGYDYYTEEKKDHMMRAVIEPHRLSVKAGKGWAKETMMKPIDPKIPMSFKPGQWYKGKIEFHKDHLVVHIDDKVVFYGVALISQEAPKNRITLTANGTVSFRNVKLWSGTPRSDWEKTRKTLVKRFSK